MLHWFFPGVVGVWMGQWSHRTLLEMNLLMFHAVLQVQSVAGAILFKCAFVSPIDDRVEWIALCNQFRYYFFWLGALARQVDRSECSQ